MGAVELAKRASIRGLCSVCGALDTARRLNLPCRIRIRSAHLRSLFAAVGVPCAAIITV